VFYKSNQNYDMVMGRKSEEQVTKEFFQLFDKNSDGKISWDEWIAYYSDVSSMTGGMDAFSDLLNSTWGGADKAQNLSKEATDQLVNLIRERLVTQTKGVEDEFKLQKLFKSFDKHNSGLLAMQELDGILLRLNLVVPKHDLPALFKALDRNRSGYIEFDDFCNFILYNPYKK
jgi:Ca2+-binding EF-hand superfamily protein